MIERKIGANKATKDRGAASAFRLPGPNQKVQDAEHAPYEVFNG